jgi:hypothetical protein
MNMSPTTRTTPWSRPPFKTKGLFVASASHIAFPLGFQVPAPVRDRPGAPHFAVSLLAAGGRSFIASSRAAYAAFLANLPEYCF